MGKKSKYVIYSVSFIVFLLAVFFYVVTALDDVKVDGLSVGEDAPEFSGIDQNGKLVSLSGFTQKGPVVLIFYRGYWCPYCNTHLSQLQDSLQLITTQNATVVAVAPELEEYVEKTVEKTGASFPVISDKNLEIMKLYKVDFQVASGKAFAFDLMGVDFNEINQDGLNKLPVPATYIIDMQSKIRYVHFNADYKKRASVAEIIKELNKN